MRCGSLFRDYCRPDGLHRPCNRPLVQYGKEPALIAALDRRRPGVGPSRLGVAREVEYVNDAFPYGLTLKRLRYRHGLRKLSFACVHVLDSAL